MNNEDHIKQRLSVLLQKMERKAFSELNNYYLHKFPFQQEIDNTSELQQLRNLFTKFTQQYLPALDKLIDYKNNVDNFLQTLLSYQQTESPKIEKPTDGKIDAFLQYVSGSKKYFNEALQEAIADFNKNYHSIEPYLIDNNQLQQLTKEFEDLNGSYKDYKQRYEKQHPSTTKTTTPSTGNSSKKAPSPNGSPVKKPAGPTTPVAIPSEEHLRSFEAGHIDFMELDQTLFFTKQQRSKKLYDYMQTLFNPQFNAATDVVAMIPQSNACYQLVFDKIIQMVVGKLSAQQDFKNLYITSQQIDDVCKNNVTYTDSQANITHTITAQDLANLMKNIVTHFNNYLRTRDTIGNIVEISQESPTRIIVTKNAFFYLLGLFNAPKDRLETLYNNLYDKGQYKIDNGEYEN